MSVLHTLDCLLHCVCGNILAPSPPALTFVGMCCVHFCLPLFFLASCSSCAFVKPGHLRVFFFLGFYCVYVFECHNIKTPCGVHATNFCPYRNDNLVWTW
uniref:Secreted protein n=1 Tax=Ixodes ricinus TaxID=34613 RepID=A0A6B0UGQ8_IXORI